MMILTVPQPAEEAIDVTSNDYQKAANATKQAKKKQVTESINPAEPHLDMADSGDEGENEEKPEWNELQ